MGRGQGGDREGGGIGDKEGVRDREGGGGEGQCKEGIQRGGERKNGLPVIPVTGERKRVGRG